MCGDRCDGLEMTYPVSGHVDAVERHVAKGPISCFLSGLYVDASTEYVSFFADSHKLMRGSM